MAESSTDDRVLAVIRNIPPKFHSKDLRQFFSTFVETGRFACFHYRHRPENGPDNGGQTSDKSKTVGRCCLVQIAGGPRDRSEFIRAYNGKYWTNENGDALPGKCRIHAARLGEDEPVPIELKPPIGTLPRGNVGTPTSYFLQAIKECRLPASVIGKLGLRFPKTSGRRIYSNVPPPSTSGRVDFGSKYVAEEAEEEEDEDEEEPAEEWDRHAAQYDDITDQERAKERLYEEDMEVVWEKGGPGLVFYTDAYYWDQEETDTDAKWADDWDVDMNVYNDPVDADKDARDSVTIRREAMLRSGQLEESMFKRKRPRSTSSSWKEVRHDLDCGSAGEGAAAADHTKGFGRKVMEKHGWKPGTGLGATVSGKVESVHDELKEISRRGLDKRGFGYFSEKINRKPAPKPASKRLITTVYDDPSVTDPPESLLTRHEPTWNKHR